MQELVPAPPDSLPSGLQIRMGTAEDAPEITEIFNAYIRQKSYCLEDREQTTAQTEDMIRALGEREFMLVLECAGEIIGWCSIKRYSPRGGFRFSGEITTYVRVGETGKGYGTHLKRAAIEKARILQYHHLVSRVIDLNMVSVTVNQKLGFRVVGRQHQVGYLNGAWCDVIIMQLLLGDSSRG